MVHHQMFYNLCEWTEIFVNENKSWPMGYIHQ
jgi:hypothetical protein